MLDSVSSDTGPTNQTAYYTYNQHQDVEALTSGTTGSTNGSAIATYGYTAYGNDDPNLDSGLDAGLAGLPVFPFNSYRFNSGRVNEPTGNLSMGFRTYDPNINSFISRDSYDGASADMGMAGGSRYAFAGGNPISNIEQNGHFNLPSFLGGLGAGLVAYGVCNVFLDAETFGAGVFICGAVAGVAGGLASQTISCGEAGFAGGACSTGAFTESAVVGGATGLVTAGVATGLAGLLPDSLAPAAAGAISGAAGGAAGGDVGYGISCAIAHNCSWGGLAASTALGGGIGGAFGAIGGAVKGSQAEPDQAPVRQVPSLRGPVGGKPANVDVEPAQPGWTVQGQLQVAAQRVPQYALFLRRSWSQNRAYVGAVNIVTGDIALASSGCGYCAEGNALLALGGDPSTVVFTPAYTVISAQGFLMAVVKPVCVECQLDYPNPSTQFMPGVVGDPNGPWYKP